MEVAIQQLTQAIQQQNSSVNWAPAVSAVCSAISLITIILLLIERMEKKRPYLQVSFELVKSSLVCIVIRNVGEVPAKLREICFDKEFVKQIPERGRSILEDKKDLNISIYPNQKWVICLDIAAPFVMKFKNTKLEIKYKFSAIGKLKSYSQTEIIEFKDYKGFLVYISDVDELSNEVKKLGKNIERIDKTLNKLYKNKQHYTETQTYSTLSENHFNTVVTGHGEPTILNREEQNNE